MEISLTITGSAPLIMHNGRLSDPLDPTARNLARVTSKRMKTDSDHEEVADVEWLGALYYDDTVGPFIPGENVWRSVYDAAGQDKMRPRIKKGFRVLTAVNPLVFDGPRDIERLMKDESYRIRKSVRIGMSRLMRTRPLFSSWGCQVGAYLDENVLDVTDLTRVAENAGRLIGLGDWRPTYGTFDVRVAQVQR